MRRRRHIRGMTEVSSRSAYRPDVTGDAIARYERLSHGAPTWYDLMPTPANGADGGSFLGAPPAAAWPVFDGASLVTIGQPAKLDFSGAFTISFWVKQSVDAPAGWERVVARDAGGANRCYVANEVDTSGQFAAFLWRTVGGLASATTSLAKDTAGYAGVMDTTKSVGTQVTDSITPNKSTPTTPVEESVQVADATPTGNKKGFNFNKTRDFSSKKDDVKIDKVAKHGGEQIVEVDYETLQELIKAGADIEII